MNCAAYSSFEGVSSDHRIVTAKIRKNALQTTTSMHCDWTLLNNKDIRDKYVIALRKKFDALQEKTETHTPNDSKYIATKHRTKSRVPWETLEVREKRADVKTAFKCNRMNSTNSSARKRKKAQNDLAKIYPKNRQNTYKIR